jgi:hypothetical protein
MSDAQVSNDFEILEDMIANHNFPSFQEFVKNPERLRGSREEFFESIQNGSTSYNIGKMVFYWRGIYEAKSLEKLQNIAKNEGYEGNELEMEPIATERISLDKRKTYDFKVNVWPKGEFKAMGGVVANA